MKFAASGPCLDAGQRSQSGLGCGRAVVQELLGLELLLPGFEREQLLLQRPRRHAIGDRLHDPSEPPLDLGQLRAQPVPPGVLIAAHPIDLAHVLGAELLEQRTLR